MANKKRKQRGIGTKIVDVVSVGIIGDVSAPMAAAGGTAGRIAAQFTPLAATGTLKRFGDDILLRKKKLKGGLFGR